MKIIISILFILTANPEWGSIKAINGYHVGDFATDFRLKNINGELVSLANYQEAKGFIIVFTCNTCPFAILYEQRIIDLHNKYSRKGYPVIALNPNDPYIQPGDSFENMQRRAKDKNYPFQYLSDESQETTKTYGATNTPHIVILKKLNDKYQVMYTGAIDNNPRDPLKATKHYVETAMEEILSGNSVVESETKAIGCAIKWKS